MAPQPLDPGQVVNTTNISYKRVCYQLANGFGLVPSLMDSDEDCLYLNVHVPGVWPPSEPLAVMIWFTGGMFEIGI